MSKKPNPELIDEENPEWTAKQIAKARPASEVLPKIFGAQVAQEMLKPRGPPAGNAPQGANQHPPVSSLSVSMLRYLESGEKWSCHQRVVDQRPTTTSPEVE